MPCPGEIEQLENESLAMMDKAVNEKLFKFITGPKKIAKSPIMEGLTSKSQLWKKVVNNLFNHEFILKKNIEGIASPVPVETLLRESHARLIKDVANVRKLYGKHIGISVETKTGAIQALIKQLSPKLRQGKMSFNEFNAEVAKAMRRGDTHRVPEVEAAAKVYRKQLDDLTKRLQELELLPEELELKTATSYLPRRYNIMEIVKRPEEFKDILYRHMAEDFDGDVLKLEKEVNEVVSTIKRQGSERLMLDDIVDRFVDPDKKFQSILKQRTLNIPDEDLEEFLINDATNTLYSFVNQASALIHTTERMRKMGFSSIGEIKKAISEEYRVLGESAGLTEKQRTKIFSESERALEAVQNDFAMIMGRFGTDDPNIALVRKYLATTMLGGILISSLPDIGIAVFKHGLPRTFKDGIVTSIKNFDQIKVEAEVLSDFHVGIEKEMGVVLKSQVDPSFQSGSIRNTPVDRAINTLSDVFTKSTFITDWNSLVTRIGAHIGIARTVRAMKKIQAGETLPDVEVARLAKLGIGKAEYKTIQRNLKFVEDLDGGINPNYDKWDKEAQELMARAVSRDEVVFLPSRGDIPEFFQSSSIGRLMFMFKSFTAAATNKVFLPALQRRGSEEFQGILAMTMLGAMSYATKEKLKGNRVDTDLDRLIVEGMTRSGVFGLMGDAIALTPIGRGASRFAGMTAQGFVGGPGLTTIGLLADLMSGITDGNIDQADRRKMAKLLPFNNVFYLKPGIQSGFVEGP